MIAALVRVGLTVYHRERPEWGAGVVLEVLRVPNGYGGEWTRFRVGWPSRAEPGEEVLAAEPLLKRPPGSARVSIRLPEGYPCNR